MIKAPRHRRIAVSSFASSSLTLLVMLATTTSVQGAGAETSTTTRTPANETLEQYVVRVRRELHKIPETCYDEVSSVGDRGNEAVIIKIPSE